MSESEGAKGKEGREGKGREGNEGITVRKSEVIIERLTETVV